MLPSRAYSTGSDPVESDSTPRDLVMTNETMHAVRFRGPRRLVLSRRWRHILGPTTGNSERRR